MATKTQKRGRGRPRGQTEQGEASRQHIYKVAVKLIAKNGYQATTLREIAHKADVSVGLLYRYFPNKQAVVLALYDELSGEYASRAAMMRPGRWRTRFLFSLRTSLEVLGDQRATLSELLPVLVSNGTEGIFAPATGDSRERVQAVFRDAVYGASDRPREKRDADALSRILYLLHLTVILAWLTDKSPDQRATVKLINAIERLLPRAAKGIRLKSVRRWLRLADTLIQEGLLGADSLKH